MQEEGSSDVAAAVAVDCNVVVAAAAEVPFACHRALNPREA